MNPNTMKTALHRPSPVLVSAEPVDRRTSPAELADRLLDGSTLVLTDRFATGRAVLRALNRRMPTPASDAPYAQRREHRKHKLHAARRLLAPIAKHIIDLAEAPACGFLAELYPDLPDTQLSFVDLEDLCRAWRIHDEGVHLDVLGHRLHPFYAAYAPTRTEHLELFGTWLSQFKGSRTRAADVGTGCGVLALMLARSGASHVVATDINPNAVESVRRQLLRHPAPIEPVEADLLAGVDRGLDLIVFNPPWIRGDPRRPLDRALFYEDGLFERFFAEAAKRLTPEGRVVMVFSNILRLGQKDVPHPIDAELERGRFVQVQKLQRRIRPSGHGEKRRTKERVEIWELARSISAEG